ncbi:MAG: peptidase C11 [Oscillospiraceae bacterium]|nr:peptidase C11 [Oscillospiraceae bacterium]
MENKRPTGHKKNVTGSGKSVYRRGEGLGTGPIGNGGPNNFGSNTQNIQETGRKTSNRTVKRSGGALSLVAIAALLLFGGNNLFGGEPTETYQTPTPTAYVSTPRPTATPTPTATPRPTANIDFGISPDSFQNIYSGNSSTEVTSTNTTTADTTVSSGAREKRTVIKGDGTDKVTVMIYMCGTDLESRSSMATKDLVEMTKAKLSSNVRIIVYTGGCTRWNNSVVSSDRNQIYEVKNGGLERLSADMGNAAMTNPDTLSGFIKWCAQRYPANRNELILWDHGGGSVSGYGYDEKYPRSGSMSLAGINQALKDSGVTFDFVGFDACLMATLETGLMLDNYADYMIASEETEPGIGWYYTNWLNKLSSNPGMPTVEVGKNIVDDFVSTCASQTRGQSATLSVVDLAELTKTVPSPLKKFSKSLTTMIKNNEYQQISTARNGTREFARSSVIDQIDLVHFTKRLGTKESEALAKALQKAIKYNRTSDNMSDSYGISIYFPYRRTNKVDAACSTYDAIGMDESYSDCIRAFASLEVSGQAASGVGGYSMPSILTGGYGSSSSGDMDMISELLNAFLGGGYTSVPGYSSSNTGFFSGRAMNEEETARYIADNSFDPTYLVWNVNADGEEVIALPDEQWALIEGLDYNLFYDDGNGYINLGLDNVFDFDDNGNLLAPEDNTWIAINGQPVAYYHEYTVGEGDDAVSTGFVPALLNGERVNIMIRFDPEHPYGTITGLRQVYDENVTETVAKGVPALTDRVETTEADWVTAAEEKNFWKVGDTLDFICEYYSYTGVYQDNYLLGDPMTVEEEMEISYVDLGDGNLRQSFQFTDLYQQTYWTPALER